MITNPVTPPSSYRHPVSPIALAALERQLAKGDKALVGNAGFRRYLKTIGGERFAIDSDKIEEERKFDGVFVLRTLREAVMWVADDLF